MKKDFSLQWGYVIEFLLAGLIALLFVRLSPIFEISEVFVYSVLFDDVSSLVAISLACSAFSGGVLVWIWDAVKPVKDELDRINATSSILLAFLYPSVLFILEAVFIVLASKVRNIILLRFVLFLTVYSSVNMITLISNSVNFYRFLCSLRGLSRWKPSINDENCE